MMRLALVLLAGLAVAASPVDLQGSLEESTRVRLVTARLRIEPTWKAEPGECSGLGPDDLKVSIRGNRLPEQLSVRLDREPRPTVHALLLDTSESMTGWLGSVREAAAEYVEKLRPEHETALVMTFDNSVILQQSITANRADLLEAVDRTCLGGATSLYDALVEAILELAVHRQRPVVVLLSDGWDTGSLHERDDIDALVRSRPDLTVFTIGFALPLVNSAGSSKRFLQKLARWTDGRYFNAPTGSKLSGVYRAIREALDNEATLSFIDPDPDTEPGQVKVTSRNPGCRVLVLGSRRARATPPEEITSAWPLDTGPDAIRGSFPDMTVEWGTLYSPFNVYRALWNRQAIVRQRSVEIPLLAPEELPRRPESVLDRLAEFATLAVDRPVATDPRQTPVARHARPFHDYPTLTSCRMFQDLRPGLSEALFADPRYRTWVQHRLRDEVRRDMSDLKERFGRAAPGVPESLVEEAALLSDEGRILRERAEAPSLADLERHLAAWLGDLRAHELFVRWEQRWIDRLLRGELGTNDAGRFVDGWHALRRVFFVPSYARCLMLLDPIYDVENNRIGFWRVLLPRPAWFLPRAQGWRTDDYRNLPLDLVPDLPFGFLAAREILSEHDVLRRYVTTERYRVLDVEYMLLGKPWEQGPENAFEKTRVRVLLGAGEARMELAADLFWEDKEGAPLLVRRSVETWGDQRLGKLVSGLSP